MCVISISHFTYVYYTLWRPTLSVLLYTYSHTLPLYLCTTIECHQAAGSQWQLCGCTTWCACGYVCSTVCTKHYTLIVCTCDLMCYIHVLYTDFRIAFSCQALKQRAKAPSCDKYVYAFIVHSQFPVGILHISLYAISWVGRGFLSGLPFEGRADHKAWALCQN